MINTPSITDFTKSVNTFSAFCVKTIAKILSVCYNIYKTKLVIFPF